MRERRRIVTEVQAAWGITERRAARFTGFARSSLRYRTVRDPMPELRARIRELAAERPRWGYRRIHVMLAREGWTVNRKRVLRLYREDGLLARRKGKGRRSQAPRPIREPLGQPNQRWSIDFVHDALANGRRFRCLTVLDEFTRESLAIEVDYSLPSSRVIEVLERLRAQRGLPKTIISDNGTEFHCYRHVEAATGARFFFATPHHSWERGTSENTNGLIRQYLPKRQSMAHLTQRDCSRLAAHINNRPRKRLDYLTPAECYEPSS